jgi:hypothetical protein
VSERLPQPRDAPGRRLDRPVRVADQGTYRSRARPFPGHLDEGRERASHYLRVGVEEQHEGGRGRRYPLVRCRGESSVGGVADQPKLGLFLQCLGTAVARCVVDDNDLQGGVTGARAKRVHAAAQVVPGVVVDDDDREVRLHPQFGVLEMRKMPDTIRKTPAHRNAG